MSDRCPPDASASNHPGATNGAGAASPAFGANGDRRVVERRLCAVLVPFAGHIHPECEEGLRELERRGYAVHRIGGFAAIDQGRSQMATEALRAGFEATMWIDADIAFHPDSVDRLRVHGLPIVCGIYPQKGKRSLACHVLPGAPSLTFGPKGGLVELLYAAAGFLFVHRAVYERVQQHHRLPVCNERFGSSLVPYFQPLIAPVDNGHWYLAEDYAFCQRAREAGFAISADTTLRLWHLGTYPFGWEEAGIEPPRYLNFTLQFGPPPEARSTSGPAVPPQTRSGRDDEDTETRRGVDKENGSGGEAAGTSPSSIFDPPSSAKREA